MNLRSAALLLLFVLSAAAVTRMAYDYGRSSRERRRIIWEEVIADLDDCCRTKHLQQQHNHHFADIARREERPRAEHLFRAMAHSAAVQEQCCAEAIAHLGGEYSPPGEVALFDADTDTNLRKSIAAAQLHHPATRHRAITRALHLENRHAARLLAWAAASEVRQLRLMRQCLHPAQGVPADSTFSICSGCGEIFVQCYPHFYCPRCLTPERQFLVF